VARAVLGEVAAMAGELGLGQAAAMAGDREIGKVAAMAGELELGEVAATAGEHGLGQAGGGARPACAGRAVWRRGDGQRRCSVVRWCSVGREGEEDGRLADS